MNHYQTVHDPPPLRLILNLTLSLHISVDSYGQYCFVRENDWEGRIRQKAKHPAKIHAFGGISARGLTQLVLFDGTTRMDSRLYTTILKQSLTTFGDAAYGGDKEIFTKKQAKLISIKYISFSGQYRLIADNHPAHKSKYTTAALDTMGVEVMNWPPESPDLNVIELVWGNLKQKLSWVLCRKLT